MDSLIRGSFSQRNGNAVSDDEIVAETTDIVNQMKKEFTLRDSLYRDIDRVLYREIPVSIPEAYQKTALEVHSPMPTQIANTITAALSINAPTVQFEPIGFGDNYEINATLREHFFEASWRRQEEEAKRRLFRLFMYSLVTKGESILKTVERSKMAWSSYDTYSKKLKGELDATNLDQQSKDQSYNAKTEEFKRQQPYPIHTTFVRPDTFYYLKSEDGISYAAEVKEVSYNEALAKFDMGLNGSGKVVPQAMGLPRAQWVQVMSGPGRTLKMIEAWDWQYCTYILCGPGQLGTGGSLGRGQVVQRIEHGYGDPLTKTLRGPYFHALGITTDVPMPDKAGLSVLYGFLELFPLLDSLLTIQANSAYMYGFPAFKRKSSQGGGLPAGSFGDDGADSAKVEIIEPGTIYPDDIEAVNQPTGGVDVDKMLGSIRTFLDLALPPVIQGASGDASGYALNQAQHLARLAWDPIVDNAEFALAERIGFESWLIDNRISEPVYVWGTTPKTRRGSKAGWLGIGPDDLKGVHRYQVRLNPETPSAEVIDVRTHAEKLQLKLESRSDAIKALGGNPDEVEQELMLEQLKQDPAIQDRVKERVFAKLATINQKALGNAPQVVQQEQQGQGPPPGAALGNIGQVFQAGQNGQPLVPTPQGAVTGAGVGQGQPAGMPVTPGTPANALNLPGQG